MERGAQKEDKEDKDVWGGWTKGGVMVPKYLMESWTQKKKDNWDVFTFACVINPIHNSKTYN